MENEMKEEGGLPASIKDYLENGPFELKDVPGREDVTLTRQFGDEKYVLPSYLLHALTNPRRIQVTFSIADLNSIDPEADYQDRAMNDEEDNINQGNPNEFKVAPEDSVADNEGANEVDEHEPSFPARVNVIVEKPGHGALAIETVAQDGMIVIENVYHYADAAHAHAATTEKLHERQDMYVGPPFSNLDEDLQVLLERYLEERGVNTALAIFIPDYIDAKEQKEYLGWLSNVKNFVEA